MESSAVSYSQNLLEWDAEKVCSWISYLGLAKYSSNFKESKITGDVLVHLTQSDLCEIGVMSVGHRLRILKSIYNLTEVQEIQVGPDRYIPPTVICLQEEELARTAAAAATGSSESGFASSSSRSGKFSTQHVHLSSSNGALTLDALPHILKLFEVRDERMSVVENELRRLVDNYSRLREELLPIFRMFKESKPLPLPLDGQLMSPSQNHHHHHINTQGPSSPLWSSGSLGSNTSSSKQIPQLSIPKGSARRKSFTNQPYLSSQHDTSSHQSPTRATNSNSTDWLDTSSFYGGSGGGSTSNSGTLTQPISLSSYAPSNNVVTTTITTSGQPTSYGLGTPTTASTVLTNGSGSSNHSFPRDTYSSEEHEESLKRSTDTKYYNKIIAASSSPSTSTPSSASKKLFSSSLSNQQLQQPLSGMLPSPASLAKPPLSHSVSLPHPSSQGIHDIQGVTTSDHRTSAKPTFMSLAVSSAGQNNCSMSISTTGQSSGQRSASSSSHYNNGNNNNNNNNNSNSSASNSAIYDNEYGSLGNNNISNSNNNLSSLSNLLNGMGALPSMSSNANHSLVSKSSFSSMNSPIGHTSSNNNSNNNNNNSNNSNNNNNTSNTNSNISGSSTAPNNSNSASSVLTTHRTSDPIKDFNIPPDVPCYKVLPKIAKKHKVRGDACELVVCYDDQERMVGLDEFPLKIFKELQARGKNPVFMIRESTGVKPGVGFVVNGTPGGLL